MNIFKNIVYLFMKHCIEFQNYQNIKPKEYGICHLEDGKD